MYSRLLIFLFILIAFFEYTIFNLGDLEVSVQKLFFALAIPIIVIFEKRLSFSKQHRLIFIFFCSLYILSATLQRSLAGLELFISSAISFLLIILLLHHFKKNPNNFIFFLSLWVTACAVSSVIAGLQFFHIIGYFNLSENIEASRLGISGFYRGTGLKRDPNFLALLLAIGLSALIYLRSINKYKKHHYIALHILILLGIFFTQSRMGIILYFISMIVLSTQNVKASSVRLFKNLGLASIALFIALLIVPQLREGISERFNEARITFAQGLDADLNESGNITSSTARYALLKHGTEAALDRPLTGWGVGKTIEAINSKTPYNLKNVAHNTYLEYFVTYGLWGLLFIIYFMFSTWPSTKTHLAENLSFSRSIYFVFFASCLFLTHTFSTLAWLPLLFICGASYARNIVTNPT